MPDITSQLEHFRITEWHSVLRPGEEESVLVSGEIECEARMHEDPTVNRMMLECTFDIHGEDREVFSIKGVAEAYFSLSARDDDNMDDVITEQCIPVVQKEIGEHVERLTEDLGFAPVKLNR